MLIAFNVIRIIAMVIFACAAGLNFALLIYDAEFETAVLDSLRLISCLLLLIFLAVLK